MFVQKQEQKYLFFLTVKRKTTKPFSFYFYNVSKFQNILFY